jgi:hypothetical protein
VTTCRDCPAEVLFVPTGRTKPDGKPVFAILDAKPEKRVVLIDVQTGVTYATSLGPPSETTRATVVDTYTPHHATCPAAAAWKGRTRSNPP